MRITATYRGKDRHGNVLLHDLEGDFVRDHAFLNGRYNEIPPGIRPGQRIKFCCSPHYQNRVMKITDCREVEVLA